MFLRTWLRALLIPLPLLCLLPAPSVQVRAQNAELPLPRPLTTGDAALDTPLDLVEFRDLPLLDAMRLLSLESGLKIVPSAEAGRVLVSLYLRDVTPLTAVAEVARANGLIYRREPDTGIVRIYTSKENQRDLADFRDEQTEVFTLLYPNALAVATAIRDVFGPRVLLTTGVEDRRTFDDLQERFDRFDLINSRSLGIGYPGNTSGATGTGASGGGGGVATGGGAGGGGNRGGGGGGGGGAAGGVRQSDVLRDQRALDQQNKAPAIDQRLQGLTPEEIQELENAYAGKEQPDRTLLLTLLRRRPANIYVTTIRQHNQLIVRTSDLRQLDQIRDLIYHLDVPTPAVLLELKILSINLSDSFASMFDFQFTDGALTAGGFSPSPPPGGTGSGFSSGNILPPFADQSPSRFQTVAPGPLGTPPPNNFLFQVVSAGFRARLQLLEDANRVTELAAPLLMTANNEVSQIFTGMQIPITVGFTPSQILAGAANGTTTSVSGTPITTLQQIGTSLLITPNINADRTVTLRILEEVSSAPPTLTAQIPIPNATGGISSATVQVVQEQTFTGTVIAKDGLAIAVGGLIDEVVSDDRAEVPVIGKVPILGFFFRQQQSIRTRTELVLIIRPFVLTTPAETTEVSKSLVDSISIHPNVIKGDLSNLGTYTPPEVLRPRPPETFWQNIFRVHTFSPKDF